MRECAVALDRVALAGVTPPSAAKSPPSGPCPPDVAGAVWSCDSGDPGPPVVDVPGLLSHLQPNSDSLPWDQGEAVMLIAMACQVRRLPCHPRKMTG